jgi:hypothetical protein
MTFFTRPLGGVTIRDQIRDQQRSAAAMWLQDHWSRPRACPICGTQNWIIGDLVEVPIYTGGARNLYAGARVMVPITCSTCYYTWQFDAVESGIIPKATQ